MLHLGQIAFQCFFPMNRLIARYTIQLLRRKRSVEYRFTVVDHLKNGDGKARSPDYLLRKSQPAGSSAAYGMIDTK